MVSESKITMIHNHVVSHITGKFFAEYITKYLPSWKFQSQTTTETWIRMEQLFAEEFPGGEVNYFLTYISIAFHTFKYILYILFFITRSSTFPRPGRATRRSWSRWCLWWCILAPSSIRTRLSPVLWQTASSSARRSSSGWSVSCRYSLHQNNTWGILISKIVGSDGTAQLTESWSNQRDINGQSEWDNRAAGGTH